MDGFFLYVENHSDMLQQSPDIVPSEPVTSRKYTRKVKEFCLFLFYRVLIYTSTNILKQNNHRGIRKIRRSFSPLFHVADIEPFRRYQPGSFDFVCPLPVQRVESHIVPVIHVLEEVHRSIRVRVIHGIQMRRQA